VSDASFDRFATARSVADAVLYEGYVLYPYRASSRKNQARFQWGVLMPKAFSEADGSERWASRTECLVDPGEAPAVSARLRFLQTQHRTVEAVLERGRGEYAEVGRLEVDGILHVAWDEAIEHVFDIDPIALSLTTETAFETTFSIEGGQDSELIRAAAGATVGRFVRRREPLQGRIAVRAGPPSTDAPYMKVSIDVENTTPWTGASTRRDDAISHSLVAVHTMLAVDGGRFASMLDPPVGAQEAARSCRSSGTYPVLVGGEDVVLSSPIILYDHPEVAPQSPGDLYDSLEIDEILALRIMTLTDEEKAEARGTDPRAAAIIDRCDNMSAETLGQLHGQMRHLGSSVPTCSEDDSEEIPWWDPVADATVDPWNDSVWIGHTEVAKGCAVRLHPSQRADAQDMFFEGLTATVAGVFSDVDGETHLAVSVDDDPATAELVWQGRFLFFRPDEVEPLADQELSR
jgi:hypothetical protein